MIWELLIHTLTIQIKKKTHLMRLKSYRKSLIKVMYSVNPGLHQGLKNPRVNLGLCSIKQKENHLIIKLLLSIKSIEIYLM